MLAVSIASCKLGAIEKKIPLYKHLGNSKRYQLPLPMLNIINGGVHANNNLDIQEYMIVPIGANYICASLMFSKMPSNIRKDWKT